MKTYFFEFTFTGNNGDHVRGDGTMECEWLSVDAIRRFKSNAKAELQRVGVSADGHVEITHHLLLENSPDTEAL